MSSVGFESTISAGERRQAYTLDFAATGPAFKFKYMSEMFFFVVS
jgi:hypothetical protein